jgi:hypothetical protein
MPMEKAAHARPSFVGKFSPLSEHLCEHAMDQHGPFHVFSRFEGVEGREISVAKICGSFPSVMIIIINMQSHGSK